MDDPSDEQYKLLGVLFEEWCKSGRSNLLHHMFEVIESHESKKIRQLVLDKLREHYPDKNKEDIIDLWITHPIPVMRNFIRETIEHLNIKTPLKAAAYVMLDDLDKLSEIDPDFHHLDIYLRDLDPLLGSLLIQRVEQLKHPEHNYILPEILEDNKQITLVDRIRKRDFAYLWENILDYPFPFIVELIKIFTENDWHPVDHSGQEYLDILSEQLGTSGWLGVEHVKWVVVTKKEGSKYIPLSNVDIERREFELRLSQDLIVRPDRIKSQKFQSRGRFNLTDPELGIHIYMETVRKSDFDGLLHVPIYSNNGVELAEFAIPATSEKNFVMDEDGMYFTVKNKHGIFSVDMDALAAILLPVGRHSENVNEMIPILLERANETQLMPLKGLNLLSVLHRGREFSLWDLKEQNEWDDKSMDDLQTKECLCTISIDIGNSTTKIAQVVKGSCEHEPRTWEFPTIIYYETKKEYIIGDEVFNRELETTTQTFRNIKDSLRFGNKKHLRIQSSIVTSYDAYRDFLIRVINHVKSDLNFLPKSIALTFPLHSQLGFEAWLRGIVQEMDFRRVELIDELSATILGSYRLQNQRGNALLIDIGSSHMGIVVAKLHPPKSRKRLEDSRMREDFEGKPEIITKLSTPHGSAEIGSIIYNQLGTETPYKNLEFIINNAQKDLASKFEADLEINGKKLNLSLNPAAENTIDILNEFEKSDIYFKFKILLRNILMLSHHRGVKKDDIDIVLVTGRGSHWPGYLEYVKKIFSEKEVILEDDPHLTAKGVGMLANGQRLDIHLDRDYLLKISNNGIIGYTNILKRGEKFTGRLKIYEVRPNTRMDKIVIDCWVRKPEIVFDENVQPLKDNELTEHHKNARERFHYDRIYREIQDIKGDTKLQISVSSRGTLYFKLINKEEQYLLPTNSSII